MTTPRGESTSEDDSRQEATRILEAYRAKRVTRPLTMRRPTWDRLAGPVTPRDVKVAWERVRIASISQDPELELRQAEFNSKLAAWLNVDA